VWDEVLPPQMAPSDRYIIASTETLIPDDGEEYVCYGTIVYNTAYKEEKTTSWKHSVVRKGAVLETNALPGVGNKKERVTEIMSLPYGCASADGGVASIDRQFHFAQREQSLVVNVAARFDSVAVLETV
jgi:hypothetical protein